MSQYSASDPYALLSDVLDPDELHAAVRDGWVSEQRHPWAPYSIYNYTRKTQYENRWTDVTRTCRGLIVHNETDEILARPFPKFFNFGQPGAPTWHTTDVVHVFDKMDGSLGIGYQLPNGAWAIATRGSFTSRQAVIGTQLLWLYEPISVDLSEFPSTVTPLFEIIYPENRIVLDYGDERALVLLDVLRNATGESVATDLETTAHRINWTGPVVERLGVATYVDALAIASNVRPNAEGVVMRRGLTSERVKVKQEDYVALHRIMTGTSARTIWEYLAVNACRDLIPVGHQLWGTKLSMDPKRAAEIIAVGDNWRDKLLENVPDEFDAWVRATIGGLTNRVQRDREELFDAFEEISTQYIVEGAGAEKRKWFALRARELEPQNWHLLMALFNGNDVTPQLWLRAYPKADVPFATDIDS